MNLSIVHTFLIGLLYSSIGYGQQVISTNSFPTPAVNYTVYLLDTTDLDPGLSGPDALWDFSNLNIIDTAVYEVVPGEEGKQSGVFGKANRVVSDTTAGDFQSYYYHDDRSLFLVGEVDEFAERIMIYSNYQALISYPFFFCQTLSDDYKGQSIALSHAHSTEPVYRRGTIQVTADAYGIILLPNDQSLESIRVKTVKTYRDSTCISCGINFYRTDEVTETAYDWYVDSLSTPVFSITYVDRLINDVIKSPSQRAYMADVSSLPIISPLKIKRRDGVILRAVGPIPIEEGNQLTLLFQSRQFGEVSIAFSDINGRSWEEVITMEGDKQLSVSLDGHASGIYHLRVKTPLGEETVRVQKGN